MKIMLEIYEHNKSDCIKLLNMIICEIPFIKSFSDDFLLERLLNLISMINNAFDNLNHQLLDSNVFDSEEERETAIREWLLRHYSAKCFIDDLNFNDLEDRARVTVLIINILFKLRHSLKDIEQYLKDCDSFVQFDRQLNDITRFGVLFGHTLREKVCTEDRVKDRKKGEMLAERPMESPLESPSKVFPA